MMSPSATAAQIFLAKNQQMELRPKADPEWSAERPDPARSRAPYRVFNIGNNRPVHLLDYIAALERCLGRKAKMDLLPMQPGDVASTQADVSDLEAAVGFHPDTPVEEGIRRFVEWYRDYYQC